MSEKPFAHFRCLALSRVLLPLILLGAVCSSPVEARPRIKESRLDRAKDDVREPLFTEWMDPNNVGDFVERQEKFPIYQEINRKRESRVLLIEKPERLGYYFYCLMPEDYLLSKHQELTGKGLQLITLSEDADGRYSATWVNSESFDHFKAKLDELGISLATLEE